MKSSKARILSIFVIMALAAVLVTGCASLTTGTGSTTDSSTPSATATLPAGKPAGGMGGAGGSITTTGVAQQWLDVAYASASSAQKLDIYLPSGNGPFPVIVAIHGGAFMMGDKASSEMNAQMSAIARGYAVVSINYRLSGEALWPAQINDAKAAVRFLRANAATYKLDPDNIAAWGGSAGGNIASMLGTTGDVAKVEDMSLGNADQSSRVQAVVDWFGPTDFSAMDAENTASGIASKISNVQTHSGADSPESRLLGGALATVPELVKAADPTTYITADDPAFFIEHGTLDGNVPTQQSVNFAAALTKVLGDGKVTIKLIEGAGHGGTQFETADNLELVLDFLDSYLKQ